MGLDNGIMLCVKDEKDYKKSYRLFKHESWHHACECEVAYWRKCWGIRNTILRIVNPSVTNEYEFPVTLDNIDDIIKTFKYFCIKKSGKMKQIRFGNGIDIQNATK